MSGIILSSNKYLTMNNMNKINLAKNFPMSQHTCPRYNKKFIHENSLRNERVSVRMDLKPEDIGDYHEEPQTIASITGARF